MAGRAPRDTHDPAPAVPSPESMLAPHVVELNARLAAGTLEYSATDESSFSAWASKPPTGLRQFIESLNLNPLLDALRADWKLYFHPVVFLQCGHLRTLSRRAYFEEDATLADTWQCMLLEAHHNALFPTMSFESKPPRGTPGPKRRVDIRDPFPNDATPYVSNDELRAEFETLREWFGKPEHSPSLTADFALADLTALVGEALVAADFEWSNLRVGERPDPQPLPAVPEGEIAMPRDLGDPRPWDLEVVARRIDDWLPVHHTFAERVRDGATHDGLPSFLAALTLAALLAASPSAVFERARNRPVRHA